MSEREPESEAVPLVEPRRVELGEDERRQVAAVAQAIFDATRNAGTVPTTPDRIASAVRELLHQVASDPALTDDWWAEWDQ